MLLRGRSAAHIACRAGLFVVFVEKPETVSLQEREHLIEIGPGASDAKVIECAYRYFLGRSGPVDERELVTLLAQHNRRQDSPRAESVRIASS